MSGTSLLPTLGSRSVSRRMDDSDPTLPFRREMNRLFDDFFGDFGLPAFRARSPASMLSVVLTPQVEVSETDKEMRITAELPGIDPKEVEVSLMDDVLSIRAEKSSKQESKDQSYHLAERSYGTFTRYLRLPFKPDPGQVQAVVKNGVVAITIPKPPESQQKAHKIEVRQDEGATDQGQAEATSQRATTRQQDTRQAASAS